MKEGNRVSVCERAREGGRGGERGGGVCLLPLSEKQREREMGVGWMNGWGKEKKYLQSSTYNSYTAKQGSKQNTVVREMGERGRSERMRGEWEFFNFIIWEKLRQRVNKREWQKEKEIENEWTSWPGLWHDCLDMSNNVTSSSPPKPRAHFCKAAWQTVL